MVIEGRNAADVIIIGGGPAGLSVAFWCAELNLRAVLIERTSELGGQLLLTHNPITNYLGLVAKNGNELRDRFIDHSRHASYDRVLNAEIASADLRSKVVVLTDGREFSATAVVIATGVRRRKLNIDGEEVFRGRGILDSGVGEKQKVAGKRVVIVGGGDAAVENAVLLSEAAEKVFVVHRRDAFRARAEFLQKMKASEKIDVIAPATVTAISGDSSLEAVSLQNHRTGENIQLSADAMLIRIGVQPNTELFAGQAVVDDEGYIVVDSTCATSEPGVYAVGDVANPLTPTVSGAVGTGATAAKAILANRPKF